MKNLRLLLFSAICFCCLPVLNAQENNNITIKVVSPFNNTPIEGAIVTLSVTCNGDICTGKTNEQGELVLNPDKLTGEATVWAMGYYPYSIPVLGRNSLTIVLVPENKLNYNNKIHAPFGGIVNEYQKQTNIETLQKRNISLSNSFADESFYKIAGLRSVQKSGMPGEGHWFNLRGVSSMVGNTNPLIVINGMIYFPDNSESPIIGGYSKNILNSISSSDIESITLLKGADAALYGSLGSNGVLLIETSKATDMETKIELSGQYGLDYNQAQFPVMSVSSYKSYINDVAKTKYPDMANILDNFPYLVDDPDYYYKFLYNNNTDWQDLIYKPAFVTDHTLKVRGGDAIAKYNFSVGVLDKKGQVDNTGFTRYNIRLNTDINLHRKISMFVDIAALHSKNTIMEQGLLLETNPLLASMRKAPLLSPYEKDANNNLSPEFAKIYNSSGNIIENNSVSNPVAIINTVNPESKVNDIQISGGLKYKPANYIQVTGLIGLNYNFNRESIFIPGLTDKAIMPMDNNLAKNTSRAGVGETFNLYYMLNGTYNRVFNSVHNVKVSVGSHLTTTKVEYDAGAGRNTASDFYKTLNYVNSSGRVITGYNELWNWVNIYTNAQYIYDNQYAIGINASVDGSSATGKSASRLKLYPAINAAWYAKNSSYLKDFSTLNKLTVRGEYSTTGNSRYSSMLSKYHYVTSPYRVLSGIVLASVPNTYLTSETNRTLNLGIDVAALNNRINLSFDFYTSKVKDLIIPKKVSSAFGNDDFYSNDAAIANSGIEAGIQVDVIHTPVITWQIGGTVATNLNKVESLGGAENILNEMQDGSALITEVGKPMYSFYGYKSLGVFATDSAASAASLVNYAGNNFKAGDIHFVDKNGDGIINQYDRFNLGDANPDFFGGFYTTVQYKNFCLSANFTYSIGNKAYNVVRRTLESGSDFANQSVALTRRWIYEGQVTDIPRVNYGDPMGNSRFSDRWIEDASYIKLKEVMLSYRLNFMEGTTVFVSGYNLLTFTDYLGSDPEFMYSYNTALQGFDYAKLALARTFKMGFKIQF